MARWTTWTGMCPSPTGVLTDVTRRVSMSLMGSSGGHGRIRSPKISHWSRSAYVPVTSTVPWRITRALRTGRRRVSARAPCASSSVTARGAGDWTWPSWCCRAWTRVAARQGPAKSSATGHTASHATRSRSSSIRSGPSTGFQFPLPMSGRHSWTGRWA
jgi:hypothetical protein